MRDDWKGGGLHGFTRVRVRLVALVCAIVGVWVFWPALDMGFFLDDFLHVAQVEGHAGLSALGRTELYTFALPEPDRLGPIQGDFLPWWRAEDLLIRFFRPLSALTYHVDHALFGDDSVLFHASSLAWYAALVAACVFLYAAVARASGRGLPTVLLAGLLFAAAREHEGNVGWLAGRYTLVSVFFCPLALLAYHRWRTTKARRQLGLALLWYALAFLGSETPIALSGFFLAYELSFARDSFAQRLRGIAPVAALALLWLVLYVVAGYGTKHTAWYIDPVSHPGEFVNAGLGGNLLTNLRNTLLPAAIEPEFAAFNVPSLLERVGAGPFFAWTTTILFVAFSIQAVFDRGTRFMWIGTLVALLPISAAPPQQRVLLIPTIGIAYVFASFVAGGLRGLLGAQPWARPWAILHVVLAVALVVQLRLDPGGARYRIAVKTQRAAVQLERSLAMPLPTDGVQDLRVLVVKAPSGQEGMYAPIIRAEQGLPWPAGIWSVSVTGGGHRLERTGEQSFRLSLDAGHPAGFLAPQFVGLFRDELDFRPGQEFRSGVLRVRIVEVDARGIALAIDVQIDRPLDHPDVRLLAFEGGAWTTLEAPAVGEVIAVGP